MKGAAPSPEKGERQPAQELIVREITRYLDFEEWGRTFDDHFCELYDQRMARNCFIGKLIYITFGF